MTPSINACPFCGAKHPRVLTDESGTVGWCQECHRAWLETSSPPPHQGCSDHDGDRATA